MDLGRRREGERERKAKVPERWGGMRGDGMGRRGEGEKEEIGGDGI